MVAIFARLIIIFKDFATACFMTLITGKSAFQNYQKCYWSLKHDICNKNNKQNTENDIYYF